VGRFIRVIVLLIVIAGLVVGGIVAVDRLTSQDAAAPVIDKPELGEATIIRTDLIEVETFEGTLRFAEPHVVVAQLAGTVTAATEVGAVVGHGDVLIEVDGQPVVVLIGERPMWRPLAEGVADGADVEQLERNLVELGYTPADNDAFEPDGEFDAETGEIVEAWRVALGLSEEPIVEFGRIVYVEQPARIAGHLAAVGTAVAPGVPMIQLSAPDREVELLLPVDRQDLVAVGDVVAVTLPDDSVVSGTISQIGTTVVAGAGPAGARSVPITITFEAALSVDIDESPVEVELETDRAAGVLAVPVSALLGLADGGYGLQVVRDGAPVLVGVDIGSFVDGLVEVTGEIAEGDTVLVPK
jgi:hypothetical protein